TDLIEKCLQISTSNEDDIILDFFAGSGTTGHAVMQLNAEDGGNRKFILCQIDEPIKEYTPAYKFCIDNNMPPVISSITIECIFLRFRTLSPELCGHPVLSYADTFFITYFRHHITA
ncbi:MAG: DNA methyltransferase, partial [Mariniphaga sp.]|nr:DNA methyltransferase [Mariniphaga sp.]